MKWSNSVIMVEARAYDEVGSGVTGGVINILGNTMVDKLAYMYSEDKFQSFLVFEPSHDRPIHPPSAVTNTKFLLLFLS